MTLSVLHRRGDGGGVLLFNPLVSEGTGALLWWILSGGVVSIVSFCLCPHTATNPSACF